MVKTQKCKLKFNSFKQKVFFFFTLFFPQVGANHGRMKKWVGTLLNLRRSWDFDKNIIFFLNMCEQAFFTCIVFDG